MHNSRSQLGEDVLRTPVILREILQQCTNRELIKLSLVNKQWNFEARSVLRNRGTLTAKICSNIPCRQLGNFAVDLGQMRVVPFSGIHIQLGTDEHACHCQLSSNGPLDPSYNAIMLDRLPWKSLSLTVPHDYRGSNNNCPARLLVQKILEDFGGVLENLDLHFNCTPPRFFRNFIQVRNFPRLKILKVRGKYGNPNRSLQFMKLLISRAPNLNELHTDDLLSAEDSLLEGSSAVLVPPYFNPLYQRVHDSLLGALRPTTITLSRERSTEFDRELLQRYIPKVLEISRTTITTLRMDLLFALPLMCYGICFENVITLEIGLVSSSLLELTPESVLSLLKSFDFTRIFPKLNKVEIDNYHARRISSAEINGFVEQGNAMPRNTSPGRAINIKRLTLKKSYWAWDSALPLLGQMFPHVETFSVNMDDPTGFPFTLLWEHFVNLEAIDVTMDEWRSYGAKNLDSAFCGIFPEEVAELRGKDDEYLKAVNIVPVMPSITCMRGLRTFRLLYSTKSDSYPMGDDHTLLFSKITGLMAFGRCPALAVTIETIDEKIVEALSHMRPYASFVIVGKD